MTSNSDILMHPCGLTFRVIFLSLEMMEYVKLGHLKKKSTFFDVFFFYSLHW